MTDRVVAAVPGWLVAVSGLVFLLFFAIVLPEQARAAAEYAGDVGSPDTRFGYGPGYLREAAEAYGEQGRQSYVTARFTFDLVWPMAYAVFFTAALGWLLRRTTTVGSRWRVVVWLPLAAMLLDYAENICTAVIIGRYPADTAVLPWLAGIFTLAKWLAITGAMVALLVLAVTALLRRGRDGSPGGSATMPT
jgi:hypothetical protein